MSSSSHHHHQHHHHLASTGSSSSGGGSESTPSSGAGSSGPSSGGTTATSSANPNRNPSPAPPAHITERNPSLSSVNNNTSSAHNSSSSSTPTTPTTANGDEPVWLSIGTEVSAKYKGAFCEAKIKHVSRLVKCRVNIKSSGSSVVVTDDNVRGDLRVGALVEVKYPGNSYVPATISKIMDGSTYKVVFDDGDEATLKRTSLCLKSGKHYSESESLDHLPLTNPEHFGNPVRGGTRSKRSSRRSTRGTTPSSSVSSSSRRRGGNDVVATPNGRGTRSSSSIAALSGDTNDNNSDIEDNESTADTATGSIDDDDSASNLTQQSIPTKDKDDGTTHSSEARGAQNSPSFSLGDGDAGKVVIIEYDRDKRGTKAKDLWYPALVVTPTTPENTTIKVNDPDIEYLVKSFKDNKFYLINKKGAKEFDRVLYCSSLTDTNSSAALRNAVDKTITWLEKRELPSQWDTDLLLGPFKTPDDETSELDSTVGDEGEMGDHGHSKTEGPIIPVDDAPSEEKDRFIAQLFKFMEERGTPMNKTPVVNGKELDLYRLYLLVNKMGGYNKITNRDSWKGVYVKSDLPTCQTEHQENIAVNQLKAAYKKYLLDFTDFHRKLGTSLSSFVNSPTTWSRSSSRPSRNERTWRVETTPFVSVTKGKTSRRKSVTTEEPKAEQPPTEQVSEPPLPEAKSEEKDTDESSNKSSSNRRGSSAVKKGSKKSPPGGKKKGQVDEDEGGDVSEESTSQDKTVGISVKGDGEEEDDLSSIMCIPKDEEVNLGDKIRVKYIKGGQKEAIYEAKVIKVDKNADPSKQRFYVHYAGWNTRYDEWIRRSVIVEVIRDKSPKRKGGSIGKEPVASAPMKKEDTATTDFKTVETPSSKRGGRVDITTSKTPSVLPPKGKKKEDPAVVKGDEEEKEPLPTRRISLDDTEQEPSVEEGKGQSERFVVDDSSDEGARRRRGTASSTLKKDTATKRGALSTSALPIHPLRSDSPSLSLSKRRRKETDATVPQVKTEATPIQEPQAKEDIKKTDSKKRKGVEVEEIPAATTSDTVDKGVKRKRLSSTTASETTAPPLQAPRVPPSTGKKSSSSASSTSSRFRDREQDRLSDEDNQANQEVARLFYEEKVQSATSLTSSHSNIVTQSSQEEKESSFLLCSEEALPMSPVPPASKEEGKVDDKKNNKENKDLGSSPTTPESLKSNTLSSLTPPHDGEDTKTAGQADAPDVLDDESSRGPNDQSSDKDKGGKGKDQQASPKKVGSKPKRGGRGRTASTSEPSEEVKATQPSSKVSGGSTKTDKHSSGYKTRGSTSGGAGKRKYTFDDRGYSPLDQHPMSPISHQINLTNFVPNAVFATISPMCKYNFCTPIDTSLDADKRIQILNDRISDLRKTYLNIKSEFQTLERRRKKSKRKDRNSGSSPSNGNHHDKSSHGRHHHHHHDRGQEATQTRQSRHLDRSASGDFSNSDTNDCFPSRRDWSGTTATTGSTEQ